MKNRPTRLEVNCETGEQTEIELTDAEITQLEQRAQERLAQQEAELAAAAAKAEAKASAAAKLAALGLTPEEIAALS